MMTSSPDLLPPGPTGFPFLNKISKVQILRRLPSIQIEGRDLMQELALNRWNRIIPKREFRSFLCRSLLESWRIHCGLGHFWHCAKDLRVRRCPRGRSWNLENRGSWDSTTWVGCTLGRWTLRWVWSMLSGSGVAVAHSWSGNETSGWKLP